MIVKFQGRLARRIFISAFAILIGANSVEAALTKYWVLKMGGMGGQDSLQAYKSPEACERARRGLLAVLKKYKMTGWARCLDHIPPGFEILR